nr:unnamed protein product [Digitaria exilis]
MTPTAARLYGFDPLGSQSLGHMRNLNCATQNYGGLILQEFSGLPDAITLPFTQNYRDIINGGHGELWRVPLGKQSMIFAARIFARYTPMTPDDDVQDAFVRSAIMLCEGTRITPIRRVFSGNMWVRQTYISPNDCKKVVNWGKLSTLLVAWQRNGRRRFGVGTHRIEEIAKQVERSIKVRTAKEALTIVDFLLRPKFL